MILKNQTRLQIPQIEKKKSKLGKGRSSLLSLLTAIEMKSLKAKVHSECSQILEIQKRITTIAQSFEVKINMKRSHSNRKW